LIPEELIQLIIDHNNLANFETWIFFKWIFKTFVAVMLITNTFNIVMAVFDVAQQVIAGSAGIISGSTAISIYAVLIQNIAFSDDIIASVWGVLGYTVLLCFTLFKTGSLAKSVFNAH
jgi:hypothetical protein